MNKKTEEKDSSRSLMGMSKEEKEARARQAAQEAIEKIHALGFPTTHTDEKGIYNFYPDGHKEYLECKQNDQESEFFDWFISLGKAEAEAIYGRATRAAIDESHAAGLPTTHMDDKGIYDLYPDGHKEYVSEDPAGEDPKNRF